MQRRQLVLYVLFLATPAAVVLDWIEAPPSAVFCAAGLAIMPLAAVMGRATDALAARLGPRIGGLLNASFGNAAELILAIIALRHGLVVLVKASLTGSIICNALLVLGTSLLVGGLAHRKQVFDRLFATLQSTLLLLAAIGLVVPSALFHLIGAQREHRLSGEVSVVLLLAYLANLVFTLVKREDDEQVVNRPMKRHESPAWGAWWACGVLLAATSAVAVLSEILVGAISGGATRAWGLSELFTGVVLVAIIGNAAEHSTAVAMAYRNKLDVSLQVSIGSSLQIALFVTPALVLLSFLIAPRPLDLHFSQLEVLSVVASVVVVALVAVDGESHWMEGVLLVSVYLIFALAFYHMPGE